MNNTFTVVGGGSAGWITALYLNKMFPKFQITLIESEEIGILGAGEGTVPNIISMLRTLNIDFKDVINTTNGTIKLGVKFQNWNGENDCYYHPFASAIPTVSEVLSNNDGIDDGFLMYGMVSNKIVIGKNTAFAKSCDLNKSPFVEINGKLISIAHFALHFDAKLFADFLKNIAIDRGVIRKEGIVEKIETDNDNFITSINIKGGGNIITDFVFDCSGFQRIIIDKVYKSEWESYKDFLPVDTAISFFLKNEDYIPPYTTALAMKYGWLWKIPLQNRTGCGYVFDSSKINIEEALLEIKETLGIDRIDIQRTFKFNAGCFKKTWVKNCVAIGLSSSFVEPLEATSIMMVIKSLKIFKNLFCSYSRENECVSETYNNEILNLNNQISKFIYTHYTTKRSDTDFWTNKKFKYNQTVLDLNSEVIGSTNKNLFDIFGPLSWITVMQGNNQLCVDHYENLMSLQNLQEQWSNEYNKYSKNVSQVVEELIPHKIYLECIKN